MRAKKGTLGFALIATVAVTIAATFGGAASADPIAHTAGLKKCLKKAKQIQDPVKRKKAKKKCRKKFAAATPGATPVALTRATLTWSGGGNSTDYDLYVFEGTVTARAASNPIANTTFSSNASGPSGTETFTDLVYTNPGARNFQFGVCHQDGGNDGSSYSIDYVTADGVHHTDTQSGTGEGFNARYSGGAPVQNTFTCPAP